MWRSVEKPGTDSIARLVKDIRLLLGSDSLHKASATTAIALPSQSH